MARQIDGLWFSNDSLVILQAGDSIFRVPKSILAARSSVFQAMFEFPQPATDREMMHGPDEMRDGNPVVRLHDSATEVEPFLRAIFDSSYFMPPPAEIEFHAVLGILRLSHKYDVDYLHKRALDHLETIYPTELHQLKDIDSNNMGYSDMDAEHDLLALPVLHEVGASWLLPYAYYSAAGSSAGVLLASGEPWNQLSPDMKQTCILLQVIHIECTDRLYGALTELSQCTSIAECNHTKFLALKRRRGFPYALNLMPLYERVYFTEVLEAALCRKCATSARARYDTVRAEIWDQLPANCGLEAWDILLQRRKGVLE
ncbi:hypothetical protein B0H19DRAFT_961697 [Mycena capillaripes]|nr:hypothetical protein B0H19DRAFT_961697 [Mycena capillaripes]